MVFFRIHLLLLLYMDLHAITKQDIFDIAKKYTNYPSTILAITGVESSYGKNILGDDSKSLGLAQIQVETALWIATKDKRIEWITKIPRKRLETLLLRNDELNIMIACIHFEYWRKRRGYFVAVSKHNGGSNNMTYYKKVEKNKRMIR